MAVPAGVRFPPGRAQNDGLMTVLDQSGGNRTIVVEALSRLKNLDAAKQARVKAMASKLLDETKGTAEFVRLCEQLDVRDRSDELLAYAAAKPTDVAAGAAIRVVMRNDPRALERALAGPDSAKVATALAASNDRAVVGLLTRIVSDPKARPDRPAGGGVDADEEQDRGPSACSTWRCRRSCPRT